MSGHESEEPPYDSVFGSELPSPDEVEVEVYHQAQDELVSSPPVAEANAKSGEQPTRSADKERPQKPPTSALEDALKGRKISEILPHLSEEERHLLAIRFDLRTGQRLISQRQAADQLGMDRTLFRKKEAELIDQISYLADKDLPDAES